MFKEIYSNRYLQFLYDDKKQKLSIGWHPGDLTTYERWILMKIFCLNEQEYEEDDEDIIDDE